MKGSTKIALLFFSRTVHGEQRAKCWFPTRRGGRNRALASFLVLQSSRTVRLSGFPVFHYHEGNQRGATFGERFANAYRDIFDQGFDAVIAVGNDSPEIVNTDWGGVARQLAAGRCVVGPSKRGGAYLIGIPAAAFRESAFRQLPWQTPRLFGALKDLLTIDGTVPVLLPTLRDINSWKDVRALASNRRLQQRLRSILCTLLADYYIQPKLPEERGLQRPFLPAVALRAPPLAVHVALRK